MDHDDGYVYNDGGRIASGFSGSAGDCVTRSIAIATGLPYREVYDAMADGMAGRKMRVRSGPRRGQKIAHARTAREGIVPQVFRPWLIERGWEWVPTMQIGSGCRVHLTSDELPDGRLIVQVSKHVTAMIDGVIHDTFDPRRPEIGFTNGVSDRTKVRETRCVYGYFTR